MGVCICCSFGCFNCFIDNIDVDKIMTRHNNDGKDTVTKLPFLKQSVAMNFVRLISEKTRQMMQHSCSFSVFSTIGQECVW